MITTLGLLKWLMVTAYGVMVTVNVLANALPINGIDTGAVSDAYPNLFAPAGVTFSIWGLIYLLLLVFIGYQFFQPKPTKEKALVLQRTYTYFIASSLLNAIWIFAWHYRLMGLTVLLMLSLLLTLIKIADLFNNQALTKTDKRFIKIPFGVYFGWITVATIANMTTFLVSIGWNGLGLPDTFWMILVLIVGAVIAIIRTWHDRNLAYGLVPVWAYYGIYVKHTSSLGFNGNYPTVITTVLVCIAGLLLSNLALVYKRRAM